MKTTIFCFSGTGNSNYVAQSLASRLEDCQLLMIPSLMDGQSFGLTEQIGFVVPVYKGFPPEMVLQFIRDILSQKDLSEVKYIFLIATRYAYQAYTLRAMELELRKIGAIASYANQVQMPDGYVKLLAAPTEQKIDSIYAKTDRKLEKIAEHIRQEKFRFPMSLPFSRIAIAGPMNIVFRASREVALDFTVTDACTACGLCYRLCTTGNIIWDGGKPSFGRACTECLRCYHRCPVQAIQFNQKVKPGRYPNPRAGYDVEYRT